MDLQRVAARFEHGGERAAAGCIGAQRRSGSLLGQRQQGFVVAAQAALVAAPGPLPGLEFGLDGALGILAPGTRLVDPRERRGVLAILAPRTVPLQRHRQIDRDHVRVGRAALAVHQLHAPVGPPLGVGHLRIGHRSGFLLATGGDVWQGVERHGPVSGQPDRAHESRARAQRFIGRVADETCEPYGCDLDLALGLVEPVAQGLDLAAPGVHVGLGPAAAAVLRLGRLHLLAGLRDLPEQLLAHRLGEGAVQPGERGVALHRGHRLPALGLGQRHVALGPRAAGRTLFGAGELLHQTDRAHRHEVACDAEAVRAIDRQVVQAELEDRIGALSGRHGPLPRGTDLGGHRIDLTGMAGGDAHGGIEGQRGRRGGERLGERPLKQQRQQQRTADREACGRDRQTRIHGHS
mmetsp:Transcript_5424/g.20631  ORF Transcript_5424/g.20631 Transcript_5424/m.20631 type:complete len:407 (-) Transcript_5424:230-1450(-)